MFSILKWITLKERIKYRKCTLVFKTYKSQRPRYPCDMFTTVSEVHGRITESAANSDLYVPSGRQNEVYMQRCWIQLYHSMEQYWRRIRQCSTVRVCKCMFVKHCFKGPVSTPFYCIRVYIHRAQSIAHHPALLSALWCLEHPSIIKTCGKSIYLHRIGFFFSHKLSGGG